MLTQRCRLTLFIFSARLFCLLYKLFWLSLCIISKPLISVRKRCSYDMQCFFGHILCFARHYRVCLHLHSLCFLQHGLHVIFSICHGKNGNRFELLSTTTAAISAWFGDRYFDQCKHHRRIPAPNENLWSAPTGNQTRDISVLKTSLLGKVS